MGGDRLVGPERGYEMGAASLSKGPFGRIGFV